MNKELINSTDLFWRVDRCCFCRKKFTSPEFQKGNYRLFKIALSSEILVMLFHKTCLVKLNQGIKKVKKQITNDPIYRWSIGEWK